MEVGGFRELDLRKGNEYYSMTRNIARLNAGRCGIYHSLRILGCSKILIPYYQCSTVKKFLNYKDINIQFYHINKTFLPIIENHDEETAFLVVNYFGLIRSEQLEEIVRNNKNVIIDNTQAFFQSPISDCYNVYSPRKFVGVSDGCYVIGNNAENYVNEYKLDNSAETSVHLFARIESGGNNNYSEYLKSEARIDASDILCMSLLTQRLLDNVDYSYVKSKRNENFLYAKILFDKLNQLDKEFLDKDTSAVPMVYPLIIEDKDIRYRLKENNVFVGQWWKYILDCPDANEWERYLSKYLLPIQIDQRYGREEIEYQYNIVCLSL